MRTNKRGNNIFQSAIHPVMLWVYKFTVGPIIAKIMFRSKAKGIKFSQMKGSFILLGNHVNNYDSMIHQYYSNRVISYVVNERIFRSGPKGILGKMMHWVHFIPKKKFSNDLKAVKLLFKAKEQGRIIGIFPEGRRNWDGVTLPILPSISTLAKSLKVPIVTAVTKGGFSSQPRWSGEVRPGKIEVEYKLIMDEEQVRKSSADEIFEAIKNELYFNESEYLKDKKIYFKSKNPAEGLERMVFKCPSCGQIGKMTSRGDKITCECGYTATFNNYSQLTSEHFKSLAEWNSWQTQELLKMKDAVSEEPIFVDTEITMLTVAANSYDKLKETDFGTAKLYKERIVFEGNETYEFALSEIYGCNIQKNCSFEFNHDKTMYLLAFPGKKNAYKWKLYTEL